MENGANVNGNQTDARSPGKKLSIKLFLTDGEDCFCQERHTVLFYLVKIR